MLNKDSMNALNEVPFPCTVHKVYSYNKSYIESRILIILSLYLQIKYGIIIKLNYVTTCMGYLHMSTDIGFI
jgi:hypothetical protein